MVFNFRPRWTSNPWEMGYNGRLGQCECLTTRHQLKRYTDTKIRIVPHGDDVIDHLRNVGINVQDLARTLQAAIVFNDLGAQGMLESQFGVSWLAIVRSPTTRIMAQYFQRFGVPVQHHPGHNHLGSHRRHHRDDDHHDRHRHQAAHRRNSVPPATHHHVHYHQTLHLHNHYGGSNHHSGRRAHNIGGEHDSHRSRHDRGGSGFDRTSHRKY